MDSMKTHTLASSGMTLVETMLALAIFAVVIVAVGAFQVSIFTNQRVVTGSLETAQDAELILKTILTELRSAAPGANGAYPIVSATTTSIAFFSDTNGDGRSEEVGYSFYGARLYRTSIPPTGSPFVYLIANQSTTTLLWNVRNATSTPIFQYFDQNYTGTSSPLAIPVNVASIRLIRVNVTLDINPNLSPAPRTYTAQMSLRNLKTNL